MEPDDDNMTITCTGDVTVIVLPCTMYIDCYIHCQVIAIVDAVDKYFIPNKQHSKALEILQAVTKVQR